MKKLLLMSLPGIVLLSLSYAANADVKTLSFMIDNQSGQAYEITLSTKKKVKDAEGCVVKSKETVIECVSDKEGKFLTPVLATFVFKSLGEGPTLLIDQDSFSLKNNEGNLAKISANMESNGKWAQNTQVSIKLPKPVK